MLTIENASTPFFSEIKNGVPHGAEIDVVGEALAGQDRAIWFELKTMDGIALHVNIRMGQHNQNAIVVNSYHNGHWNHEKYESSDLSPPAAVNIHVECHEHHYKINVNNYSLHFSHHLKKHDITRLEVRGDLLIRRMTFLNMENHIQIPPNYLQPNAFAPNPSAPPAPQSSGYPLGQNFRPPNQHSYEAQQSQPGYYPHPPPGLGQPSPGGHNYYRS